MDYVAKKPAHRPFARLLSKRCIGPLVLTPLFAAMAAFAAAQAQTAPAPRFVVVIDAAHGGSDAGGSITTQSGRSQAEKVSTLALGVRLRSLLAARGISVVTTRESDTDVDAQRRAEIANHAQAAACISLHAAASGAGVHLFFSSLPATQQERFLPWKTAQAAWVSRSTALAGVLNSALTHAGMKVTMGRTALASIDSMTCPAVAIEIGPQPKSGSGATGLDNPVYQARVAEALSAGLLQWRTESRQP